MFKKFNQPIYSSIIITFGIITALYFNLHLLIFKKSNNLINNIKLARLIDNQNCNIPSLNEIPQNASIVIGHLYGSPSQDNNFIDKNAEKFLLRNKNNLKNLFLTGDVFLTPSREKWKRLYNLLDNRIKILIAPGNHDVGEAEQLKIFRDSVKQSYDFPIKYKEGNNVFIFENSIKSGWHIQKNTLQQIKEINLKRQIILLRHNIAVRELIPLANSSALIKRDLPYSKEVENLLDRNIVIISGDGGAFKKLPRIFCRKYGNIKYIINGLGGIQGDSILVIHDDKIYSYVLN